MSMYEGKKTMDALDNLLDKLSLRFIQNKEFLVRHIQMQPYAKAMTAQEIDNMVEVSFITACFVLLGYHQLTNDLEGEDEENSSQ